VIGTPLYLAPEAFAGGWAVDARCDLYALGAVGYYLVTGQPVFTGRTTVEVLAHHLNSAPPPPSSRTANPIPPALERVLLQCLAKSPSDRPADAATVHEALAGIAAAWSPAQAASWWKSFRAARPKDEAPGPEGVQATALIDLSERR
jgi:serine/threonine-protein kinase